MFKVFFISIFFMNTIQTIAMANNCDHLNTNDLPIIVRLTQDNLRPYDSLTSGFSIITFYNAVLGRLVHLNSNLTTEPGLLEEAFWDCKKNEYILRIKPDLRFHNGRKVISEDLEFSLIRFFLTKGRSDQIAFLKNILGITAVRLKS